ncbi:MULTISPECIES: LysE family translocator [Deefgea]|uniref:LysE family translocator n=1 Tax=Deefgea chitinilytica TaxID=570276 RepID=A0ABS2C9N0_9NEIS|nr:MULTISPECIES: LysE family translocator [Deefgea]MBM5570081.1 LysE family translocator [Deefgea chitinilytica]MBM9887310.1 LysE family translocator [Deefgea sp. CFH1-16]
METFITGFLLSLSLCLDIGMVNVAMIDVTMKHGRRAGFLLGFGSCFGDLIYAVLALLGMRYLLQFPSVQWITWLGGGSLLVWLAWKMAREAWQDAQRAESTHPPLPAKHHLFGRGLILAMASPTSILWFAAVGGSLIAQATDGSWLSTSEFLIGFFAGGLAWTLSIVCASHQGGKTMGNRFKQACHVVSALLYLYFAGLVLSNGYHALWVKTAV